MSDKKGLIEELAALAGCTYMSDLHLSSRRAQVIKAAEKIEPGRYGVSDWCEAYSYVMGAEIGKNVGGFSEKTARDCFVEALLARERRGVQDCKDIRTQKR